MLPPSLLTLVRVSRSPQVKLSLPDLRGSQERLPTVASGPGMGVPQRDRQDVPVARAPSPFPTWAIALIVSFFCLANAGAIAYYVHRLRKRRRAYILSALDQGTQFEMAEFSGLEGIETDEPSDPAATSTIGDTRRGTGSGADSAAVNDELSRGLGGRRVTGRIMSAVPVRFQPADAPGSSSRPVRGILESQPGDQKPRASAASSTSTGTHPREMRGCASIS